MNWHIYSAYCEMSCNTVSYSPIRCNKAIVGESASERGFSGPGLCSQERQNRDRKNVEGAGVSGPTSHTSVCVCGHWEKNLLLSPLMSSWSVAEVQ